MSPIPIRESDRPQAVDESAEHATVALKRAIDHELGDGLKGLLAELLILELVQRTQCAQEHVRKVAALCRPLPRRARKALASSALNYPRKRGNSNRFASSSGSPARCIGS